MGNMNRSFRQGSASLVNYEELCIAMLLFKKVRLFKWQKRAEKWQPFSSAKRMALFGPLWYYHMFRY